MAKSSKPLKIMVSLDSKDQPWVEALKTKGHEIHWWIPDGIDLILAPQACRFLPGMEKMLDSIIKGVRKVKYPKENAK